MIEESIRGFFEKYPDFNSSGDIWRKIGYTTTPGQVVIVNNVRQEIPGQRIPIELKFEIVGSASMLNIDTDEEEIKYLHCSFDIIQNNESMGEVCQLFEDSEDGYDEFEHMIRHLFRL